MLLVCVNGMTGVMNSVSIEEQLNNNFSNFNNHNIPHTCTECEVVGDQNVFL